LKAYGVRLKNISVPSLLLWGMDDPNQPWDPIGKRFATLMPNATVEHFEDAGHFFQLEKGPEYAVQVLAWLSEA